MENTIKSCDDDLILMQHIHKQAIVPYSAEQMFALVDDIESYPEFLPWCKEASEVERKPDEVTATLVLSKGLVTQAFTTCNKNTHERKIEMNLVDGPFSHLQGEWEFTELDEQSCKVVLNIEFAISNSLLRLTLEPVFALVLSRLVNAFKIRAKDIYG